jgi:Flp pilus assembly protein TadG
MLPQSLSSNPGAFIRRAGELTIQKQRRSGAAGNSLVETAILLPILLAIAFNAINLGYFWFVGLTIAAAPRLGAEYVSQGGSANETSSMPSTNAVNTLVFDNLTHALNATTSNAGVRVCSSSSAAGVDSSSHIAGCDSFGMSYGFSSNTADPEAPVFVLNRVDVAYAVHPIIPGTLFHVVLPSDLTFRRQVSMRSLY